MSRPSLSAMTLFEPVAPASAARLRAEGGWLDRVIAGATATRQRSAVTLAMFFWIVTFAILSIRGALIETLPFEEIAPRRAFIAIVGAGICYGVSRYFDSIEFRSFGHRLWVAFSVALVTSILITGVHFVAYSVISPLPGSKPFSWSSSAQWVITWLGYMTAWTGVHLALLYHWQVEGEQARNAELREFAHQSKIAALRYQINPHFLFNSLNSISALILEEDKERAERMVVSLSEFFRATLLSSTSPLISLGEEIELQLMYLRIEEIRFAGRMSIEVEADPRLLSAGVPPLILQPLVENAIRHGVEQSEDVTIVRLGAQRVGGTMCVYVENCGRASPGRSGVGIGLSNVRDRLKAQFGDKARLEMRALEGGGFRAAMTLPETAA